MNNNNNGNHHHHVDDAPPQPRRTTVCPPHELEEGHADARQPTTTLLNHNNKAERLPPLSPPTNLKTTAASQQKQQQQLASSSAGMVGGVDRGGSTCSSSKPPSPAASYSADLLASMDQDMKILMLASFGSAGNNSTSRPNTPHYMMSYSSSLADSLQNSPSIFGGSLLQERLRHSPQISLSASRSQRKGSNDSAIDSLDITLHAAPPTPPLATSTPLSQEQLHEHERKLSKLEAHHQQRRNNRQRRKSSEGSSNTESSAATTISGRLVGKPVALLRLPARPTSVAGLSAAASIRAVLEATEYRKLKQSCLAFTPHMRVRYPSDPSDVSLPCKVWVAGTHLVIEQSQHEEDVLIRPVRLTGDTDGVAPRALCYTKDMSSIEVMIPSSGDGDAPSQNQSKRSSAVRKLSNTGGTPLLMCVPTQWDAPTTGADSATGAGHQQQPTSPLSPFGAGTAAFKRRKSSTGTVRKVYSSWLVTTHPRGAQFVLEALPVHDKAALRELEADSAANTILAVPFPPSHGSPTFTSAEQAKPAGRGSGTFDAPAVGASSYAEQRLQAERVMKMAQAILVNASSFQQ